MNTCTARHTLLVLALLLAAAAAPSAAAVQADKPAAAAGAPRIEVCFVLDTTGSMGGLIEGAKLKIWSIANQMVSAKPTPRLKIALIGYRDRGDEYVTRIYDLSEDIDAVYANLQKFEAGGGGDTPESVNQALHEAVAKVAWSADRGVLKIIFLVGDCPPHMDYPDDVKYPKTCEAAVKKDLIINTVQCGNHGETTPVWQDIAGRAEGKFVAIGQSGDMQVVSTPMDAELAKLNAEVGRTLVPYGSERKRGEVMAKQVAAEAAAAPAAADRLAYNASTGKAVQGGGDLVDDLKDNRVKLEEVKADELPAEMKNLTKEQQAAYLKAKAEERQKVQARIAELVKKRQEYINEEMRKAAGKGGFDEQVRAIVTEQAKSKGIKYATGDK
ncbi:MAG TPA: VWA domain-containing protein [Acidobacteriota bacterium]|nr:VWA domain-containing protein [Acidobacteriota bacterium]HNR40039.1 VWA domain-containing protein [Acidobacteriota bacterium]HNU02127.1 VWA domain-containing protein [Acidobacteriota bacterium]HPB28800.1 VWA domain-containing protein [Acidobacteriota bacterium]HQO26331.1 VWA domain-containing protein [Acidobacteriota bacterium]